MKATKQARELTLTWVLTVDADGRQQLQSILTSDGDAPGVIHNSPHAA